MNRATQQKQTLRIDALLTCIRPDKPLIDIGTDHAYLPIALKRQGFVAPVTAVDCHQKPLSRAKINIRRAGLAEDDVHLLLSNGFDHVPVAGDETIVMAGMGGFLISKILERALNRFSTENLFILQPNWTWFHLRKWLAAQGFSIRKEYIVKDQDKYYSIIITQLTGQSAPISDTEAFIGKHVKPYRGRWDWYDEYLKRMLILADKKARSEVNYQSIAEEIRAMLQREVEQEYDT